MLSTSDGNRGLLACFRIFIDDDDDDDDLRCLEVVMNLHECCIVVNSSHHLHSSRCCYIFGLSNFVIVVYIYYAHAESAMFLKWLYGEPC